MDKNAINIHQFAESVKKMKDEVYKHFAKLIRESFPNADEQQVFILFLSHFVECDQCGLLIDIGVRKVFSDLVSAQKNQIDKEEN